MTDLTIQFLSLHHMVAQYSIQLTQEQHDVWTRAQASFNYGDHQHGVWGLERLINQLTQP